MGYSRDKKSGKFEESGAVMSQKPISVLLPVEDDRYVRSLPNRSQFLREAIAVAIRRHKSENPISGERGYSDQSE